jgi:basic amino acid/polyamine antiporter, APA family
MPEGTELRRSMGWLDAASVVLGIVVGAGIFVTPQDLAKAMPSPQGMIGAWLFSGLLVFCGALAFSELSTAFPRTGGVYVYLKEAFGAEAAFSCGWVHLFALLSGATAYIAAGFGRYLSAILPLNEAEQRWVAVAVILSLSWLNARSVRGALWLQNGANVAKLGALLFLIAAAFASPHAAAPANVPSNGGSMAIALAVCFFCYEGWSYVGFVAGEIREPERNLPKIFAFSFLLVVALYLLVNLAYLRMMSVAEIQSSAQVGAAIAQRSVGPAGAGLVTATILIAIVGSLNGICLAASRLYFAQAKDGLFLPKLDHVHPTRGTPTFAILSHAAVSCAMLLISNLGDLLQAAIFSAWLYYFAAIAGLMWMRRTRPSLPRPYKMWGFPVTPLLFLLGSGNFLLSLLLQNPKPPLAVFLLILLSIPVARYLRKSEGAGPRPEVA